MFAIIFAFGMFFADLFKSSRLEVGILFLHHQLNIAESAASALAAQSCTRI